MTHFHSNPFPGLRSFEPDEDHLFFGREEQIDGLLKRLRKTRFLTVVGSSGSGKSSLVRCGLIPGLLSGYMVQAGSYWKVAILRPGNDPIGNLARAIQTPMVFEEDDLFGPDEDEPHQQPNPYEQSLDTTKSSLLEATLSRGSKGLVEAAKQLREDEHENLLVVVDQFEELFRFKREVSIADSVDTASAFVKLLLKASLQEDIPIYIVITMRSDFLENCTEFRNLPEAINRGQYLVPRMTREQQRTAITGPVAVSGAKISPRLVSRLLNDVGDNPDHLPILQHALMRTWDYWKNDHAEEEPIDLRHYQAIGQMNEALSLHAEEAYQELRSQANKFCAEKILKALTEKGQDGKGIRRPATVQTICEITNCSIASVMLVAECFRQPGRSFLMPPTTLPLTPQTMLDISHESLMRVWERLRNWVDDESISAKLYMDLAKAAAYFQEGTAGLWRDPELQLALRWKEDTQPTSAWAERYDPTFERAILFLELSKRERDKAIEVQERMQRRSIRINRLISAASTLVAIVLLILGFYGYLQKQNAEAERMKAQKALKEAQQQTQLALEAEKKALHEKAKADLASRDLAIANQELETKSDEALKAAEEARKKEAEALQNYEEAERQKAMAEASRKKAEEQEKAANQQKLEAEKQKHLAQEQTRIAQKSESRSRSLLLGEFARTLAERVPALSRQDPQFGALTALYVHQLDLSGARGGHQAEIHKAMRKALEGLGLSPDIRFPIFSDSVRALTANRPGNTLYMASGTDEGNIFIQNMDMPQTAPQFFQAIESPIRSLAASSDGRFLAVGTLDSQVFLLNLEQNTTNLLSSSNAAIYAVAFNQQTTMLASADKHGVVTLWDLEHPAHSPHVFKDFGDQVYDLAFAPDNSHLLVGTNAGLYRLSNLNGQNPSLAQLEPGQYRSVAHGAGAIFAAGSHEGVIKIWKDGQRSILRGHKVSPINDLAFSPNGLHLASASSDHTIRIWEVHNPEKESIVLSGHDSWVLSIAFDQSGDKIFSGGADRRLRGWTVSIEIMRQSLCKARVRNFTDMEMNDLLSSLPPGSRDLLEADLDPNRLCSEDEPELE